MRRWKLPKPGDRDEWLAARRPYFNASATSILFDRHPYMTPGDYATEKLTGVGQAQTRAMVRGTMLEDAIAQWWAFEHAADAEVVQTLYVAEAVMATADRWCPQDNCPVEIKTTTERAHDPRQYWLDQCQSIMLCAGADACWLVWFDASMDIRERLVEADVDLQDEIVRRAERFMAAIELGIVP
ncbi:MAG: YqaJ viral recombinase family protein, partial [Jiangellaceae bacterium]